MRQRYLGWSSEIICYLLVPYGEGNVLLEHEVQTQPGKASAPSIKRLTFQDDGATIAGV